MRYHVKSLLGMLALAICLGGCSTSKQDHALCDCARTPDGQLNMQLSDDCIQMALDRFGPTLEGMEQWYQEHCNMDFHHPAEDGLKKLDEVQS